ncbi:MAG: hypothetical protein D3903_19505 [Candidatus Electrothrix sp. GM3_4]|nr:hypothetical protein [Candidatus Electrothrix sp. GM3_4]
MVWLIYIKLHKAAPAQCEYKLTLIRLPDDLKSSLKLEIFRRINQAGTPLSPQDIRLSYYGDCDTVTFIRIAGIYDVKRQGSERMIESALEKYDLKWPWEDFDDDMKNEWKSWWENKLTSTGQTASEMFCWYLIAIYRDQVDEILSNQKYLAKELRAAFSNKVEDVADIFCAQLHKESENSEEERLFNLDDLEKIHFQNFANWFNLLRVSLQSAFVVTKFRRLSFLIAALSNYSTEDVDDDKLGAIEAIVRKPRASNQKFQIEIPEAKGKWGGKKGVNAQIESYYDIIEKIINEN